VSWILDSSSKSNIATKEVSKSLVTVTRTKR